VAAAEVGPIDTVWRRSSSLITTTRPGLPGHTCVVPPSGSLGLPMLRQSFGAVDVQLLLNVWALAGEIRRPV
jgi:hypothetical protein